MKENDIQSVRETLMLFQDGYTHRDLNLIDDFASLFISNDDLEVIGTAAIEPGDDEWKLGREAALELFRNDWQSWGNLILDVADARIHCLGDTAWLSTTGTVKMDLDSDETYRDFLAYLREEIGEDDEMPARERLLELLRAGSNTLYEAEHGKTYVWPLRFNAVLVRMNGRWLFHQVVFSYATTRYPDVRI